MSIQHIQKEKNYMLTLGLFLIKRKLLLVLSKIGTVVLCSS